MACCAFGVAPSEEDDSSDKRITHDGAFLAPTDHHVVCSLIKGVFMDVADPFDGPHAQIPIFRFAREKGIQHRSGLDLKQARDELIVVMGQSWIRSHSYFEVFRPRGCRGRSAFARETGLQNHSQVVVL